MAVHRALGPGYLENIYEEAMAIELELLGVPFERQHAFSVSYRDHEIGLSRLDFWVDGQVVVELKAVEALIPVHHAQVLSYLRMTRTNLGLLINFNVPLLKNGIRRIVQSNQPWRRGVVAVQ